MTREELVTALRDYVNEKTSDTGLLKDETEAQRWVDRANRTVYRKAVEWNDDPWLIRSVDLAYVSGDVGLLEIGIVQDPTLVIQEDGTPLAKIALVKAQRADGSFDKVEPIDSAIDHTDVESPGSPARPVGSSPFPFKWYREGNALWLSPEPSGGATLRVWYAPRIPPLTLDEQALFGKFPDAHDLVALVAAQMVFHKDEFGRTPWDAEVTEGYNDLRRALARSQGQRTRRIHRSSHFPSPMRRRR